MADEPNQNDNTQAHTVLTKGTMVGHYRVVEKIGAGGMGEVYLAEDTELDRKVALKFLPRHLCQDEDCRARFKREAQAAAALKHPNIVTIHEVSEHHGRAFFAMEHVEGESLRDLVKNKELDLARVIDLAVQISGGLAKAHQAGITHRDIKPSNISIGSDGRAKILDFGLAAIQGREHLTQTGSTLGTIGYMSPEQAEGKEVDHRSDIFSFGVILYEMITGRRPFERDNQVAIIQAIIGATPEPLARYKSNVPDELQRIVTKLLAKEPSTRYQHVDEVPVDLKAIDLKAPTMSRLEAVPTWEPTATRRAWWRRVLPWGVAALVALVAFWSLARTPASSPRDVARLVMTLPENAPLSTAAAALAVSPDGKRLVYIAGLGTSIQLFLREIDKLEAQALPGTSGGLFPFFSPDGQWIGFFSGGELKKLYLDGGKPIPLCESRLGQGGSWGIDDTILYTPVYNAGIWKISANGGEPIQVTTPAEGEFGHWSPEVLPGGKAILFTIWNTTVNDSRIALLHRETGEWRTLLTGGTNARYAPTGHLLYAQSGTMVAAPFDLRQLEIGEPHVPVLTGINQELMAGNVSMGFSQAGLLYYVRGGEWLARRRFVWVDRQGEIEPLPLEAAAYSNPRLSPDGRRLAFTKFEGGVYQIWVHELGTERMTQLTFESSNFDPVWTPDGEWLSFRSHRHGPFNIFHIPADRSSPEKTLLSSPNDQDPSSWSPDGKALLYGETDPITRDDIWLFSAGDRDGSEPLIRTTAQESNARLHPSGNWIAYQSDESGRFEVLVRPFPGLGSVIPISAGGGRNPRWSHDGRELFYVSGDRMMAVKIQTEPRFRASTSVELFEFEFRDYDVTPDGRFVLIRSEAGGAAEGLVVVFNWFEELKRLVPTE